MTMARVPWSRVRRLVLGETSKVGPACVEAVRSIIPDDSLQEADVGFPLAVELLDIYRYRYQSIEAFRVKQYGWPEFFAALEAATGLVGLLAVRCSGWRFTILLDEKLDSALACLYRPPSPDEGQGRPAAGPRR
jgi:hypothetical protein